MPNGVLANLPNAKEMPRGALGTKGEKKYIDISIYRFIDIFLSFTPHYSTSEAAPRWWN